jgi:hypothetical protein
LKALSQFRGLLVSAIEKARHAQHQTGSELSAGRYEGLCQALAILDADLQKAKRASGPR